ncbi:TonB-dependent receptor [Aureisphaera galaxeae]|uniref:TonB-dependent receptor n=1 Tax=Aureisphaera galaxeae TaxID=1538023 RepID=UPI002350F399|nr:TonB-dependent receptor [Aureisphaera galaxeae]MDC8004332.1 TonB-dependent receptor [Aureisphaera galaxeae]
MKRILFFLFLFMVGTTYSQTTVTGNVTSQDNEPILGANVIVSGTYVGTATNADGSFTLTVEENPPFELEISSIGYENATVQITQNNQSVSITLQEGSELDQVVISASRTPERLFESPVTVERYGIQEIKNSASAEFYDGLENLKGIDMNTNSLTFKSINTRGFSTFANNRFLQLVDGMDNSNAALNFPLGNLLGMIEPDVQSVEILPGAASALYGANAFNGILFMTSKNPFDHQGLSIMVKRGITSQEAAGNNDYTDVGIRAAHKFSNKFAAKVNFGLLVGTDWFATNTEDKLQRGIDRSATDYDGINVYGDEVSTNIRSVAETLVAIGALPPGADALVPAIDVSRTGYDERDLTDYDAESVKADWGLYYRPWEDDFEIVYQGKVGTGKTIYQGANRYRIDNFFQQQHKLEFRNDNFFLRGYVVPDKAGNSYDMVFTGININRAWKDDQTWFGQYVGAFVQGTLAGLSETEAHALGRQTADTGRFEPGSQEFNTAFNNSISNPDLNEGSRFQDESRYYHADGNYNFGHLWDAAEVQVGGSYRRYRLNSSGTIYTDGDGPIDYSEVGLYTQIQKKLPISDNVDVKLTGSIRYDKSELFDGFFSPRVAAGFTIAENHNIRASYQTGFRNPTTQDLFIGLDVGRAILVGSAEGNPAMDVRTYPLSASGQAILGVPQLQLDGTGAYNNSFSANSVGVFAATGDPTQLVVSNPEAVKPEQVSTIELGYRGKLFDNKLLVDLSGYYNSYEDFITNETVVTPFYGDVGLTQALPNGVPVAVAALANGDFQAFQTYTNTDAEVNSYGGSIGLTMRIADKFDLSGNYTYAKLDFDREANPDFLTSFNTPEHKVKATLGSTDLFENFGFNVAWRWSDTYLWEATFGTGQVPAFHVVDAQINYKVPSFLKSTFKLGASNLLQDEYITAFGTGLVGSVYYLSWTINN